MRNLFFSIALQGLFFTMSCGSDDSDPNNAPDAFTVTVSSIGADQVEIMWTATSDPDGDELTYDITLEGSSVATLIGETGSIITLAITGLTESTTYAGIVTADDGKKGGTTEASYSFTTIAATGRE